MHKLSFWNHYSNINSFSGPIAPESRNLPIFFRQVSKFSGFSLDFLQVSLVNSQVHLGFLTPGSIGSSTVRFSCGEPKRIPETILGSIVFVINCCRSKYMLFNWKNIFDESGKQLRSLYYSLPKRAADIKLPPLTDAQTTVSALCGCMNSN